MIKDRTEALRQIIGWGKDRDEAHALLLSHPWDSERELVVASSQSLAEALQKYLAEDISSNDLEAWANFIEGREDVDYTQIAEYVYALANPELMGRIDKETAKQMIERLNVL